MKILITGGAGFIGSNLAEHYVNSNNSVTVLDNFTSGKLENLSLVQSKLKIVNGDIRDKKLMKRLISKTDLVIHLAAALGVDNIMWNTLESISTNILGSENVLLTSAKYNKRIVIASSSEIYGKNPKQPLSETDDRLIGPPQNYRWTYSDSKALDEAIAQVLFVENGLRVTTVRLFNTIGPRQSSNYGMVVPNFVSSALENKDICVYGTGEQTRVFCNVNDVTRAISSLIDEPRSIGEVFNIGGETEISINNLAKKVISLTNSNSRIKLVPYTNVYKTGYEDMQRRVPNTHKIKELIGWKAKISLDQTILDIASSISA